MAATASGSADDSKQIKCDEELWYSDGNIVLIAQNHAFRVYKGQLAQHSEVFSGLFSMQHTGEENMEDCPVVHLPDSANELRHLLRFIFYYRKYYKDDIVLKFPTVAGLIRIGHKYLVHESVAEGLSRLRSIYGTHLPDYIAFRRRRDRKTRGMQYRPKHAIGVVNLARLISADDILPTALYDCCHLSTHILTNGVRYADGSIERLAPNDLAICFDGQRRLMFANSSAFYKMFDLDANRPRSGRYGCYTVGECGSALDAIIDDCIERGLQLHPNGLAIWSSIINLRKSSIQERLESLGSALCPSCRRFLNYHNNEAWYTLSDTLPSIFGLTVENWESSHPSRPREVENVERPPSSTSELASETDSEPL
ncbi:uncharacterized protein LAESUDRAFT_761844 [Laetiporus sulphureus 93-53]|uniref:BTB domain-containing protein n=1 Tax=Laetiporus sulphureus 93-53 TaxID=1314785 RepID=A0A165CVA7_9APHY|nr:uncharacterized protein LAESUDRAFT_761844 [Laetiporus sulphureus 93-53]KZT03493.1 hypothetical protein LAESUDRAFT_761844 [Laetiporus sulphureus 93-53]